MLVAKNPLFFAISIYIFNLFITINRE